MVAGELSSWGLVAFIGFCGLFIAGIVGLNRVANRARQNKSRRRDES